MFLHQFIFRRHSQQEPALTEQLVTEQCDPFYSAGPHCKLREPKLRQLKGRVSEVNMVLDVHRNRKAY